MKLTFVILAITFLVSFLLFLLRGKLTVEGRRDTTFIHVVYASIAFSILATLFVGLPISGIVALILWLI